MLNEQPEAAIYSAVQAWARRDLEEGAARPPDNPTGNIRCLTIIGRDTEPGGAARPLWKARRDLCF